MEVPLVEEDSDPADIPEITEVTEIDKEKASEAYENRKVKEDEGGTKLEEKQIKSMIVI